MKDRMRPERQIPLLDRLVVVSFIRPWILFAAVIGRKALPEKWGLALAYGITGLVGEIFYYLQRVIYRKPRNMPQPIFIIGHWRSATTYLHYELASSPKIATMRNSFTIAPQAALLLKPLFTKIKVSTLRPVDWVGWAIDSPQELDIAMLRVVGELPHTGICQGFNPAEALSKWVDCVPSPHFERELQRIVEWGWLHDGKGKQAYVLKTPVLTSHVALLLRLWPRAKFVYIERKTEDTIVSFTRTLSVFNKLFGIWDRDACEKQSAATSVKIFRDAYLSQKHLIPGDQLCEVKYEDLVNNPCKTVGKIRKDFDL